MARDWRSLAAFYERDVWLRAGAAGRDYRGPDLEAGTGVPGAALQGVHLRLPGHGPKGPTLEIYQYQPALEGQPPVVNRPGFGHIAFAVDDVPLARQAVLDAGGRAVGEVVTLQTSDGRRVTWCYVTDLEGNIVELQAGLSLSTGPDCPGAGAWTLAGRSACDRWH